MLYCEKTRVTIHTLTVIMFYASLEIGTTPNVLQKNLLGSRKTLLSKPGSQLTTVSWLACLVEVYLPMCAMDMWICIVAPRCESLQNKIRPPYPGASGKSMRLKRRD